MKDLELLDDPVDEYKAVCKFLRVVPRKYRQMANSIECLLNLKEMTIEDLCGWLITIEENDVLISKSVLGFHGAMPLHVSSIYILGRDTCTIQHMLRMVDRLI
jgi:hypothetical protein